MNINKNSKSFQNNNRRSVIDEDNELKEGIELPSEGEELESNYEVN